MTIGIIGGGIAGLATAIALSKTGSPVDVYEQSPEFSEVGAGLQIGPNAVSALKQLGAFEALEPQTVAPQNIRILDGLSGALLTTLPLGKRFESRFGQPYRVAHRADLLNALLTTAKTCPNINLHLASKLTRLDIEPDVTTCLFSDEREISHKTLIGADGFRSVVRRSVLNDGPPIFAGHTLYRALLPIEDAPDIPYLDDVQLWLYPNGHVVHYPVSARKHLNIVAASEQDWENKDWSTPAQPDEVKNIYPNAPLSLQKVLASPKTWLKWAAAGHPHSTTWSKHRTVLIGDAIHPTLPYLAQGAAMAMEDAVCLAHVLKTSNNFDGYIAARQERTKTIVATSSQLGQIYHLKNPKRLARNFAIRHTSTNSQYNRLAWLYNWSAPDLA